MCNPFVRSRSNQSGKWLQQTLLARQGLLVSLLELHLLSDLVRFLPIQSEGQVGGGGQQPSTSSVVEVEFVVEEPRRSPRGTPGQVLARPRPRPPSTASSVHPLLRGLLEKGRARCTFPLFRLRASLALFSSASCFCLTARLAAMLARNSSSFCLFSSSVRGLICVQEENPSGRRVSAHCAHEGEGRGGTTDLFGALGEALVAALFGVEIGQRRVLEDLVALCKTGSWGSQRPVASEGGEVGGR